MIVYYLAIPFLFPLLYTQGRYVKRTIIKLPEPTGLRTGHLVNQSKQLLKVLIIGDSAAAGVGAESQAQALSGQLAQQLADKFSIHWQLEATTGHKLQDVIARVTQLSAEPFDVVLTSIGVNDVTAGTAKAQWISQYQMLIKMLRTKFNAKHILLSALPPVHEFTALPQPLRWYMGMKATQLNTALAQMVNQHADCHLVSLKLPFNADFIAVDGFHPSAIAYALWADAVSQEIIELVEVTDTPTLDKVCELQTA